MASSPPSSSPLVWVTQGKSQHAANLLETRESDKTCLIRWNSTNKIERVPQRDVANALAPRRRRRPLIDCELSDDENEENMFMDVDATGDLTSEIGKRKTAVRDARENKDNSSDEVQVLLTILPPTPKRPKQDITNELQSDIASTEARRVSTSPQPQNALKSVHNEHDDGSTQFQTLNTDENTDSAVSSLESTNKSASEITLGVSELCSVSTSPELSNAAFEPGISNEYESSLCTDEKPAITRAQDSAYVQALAEICFTILNDARWRVEGPLKKRLFAWEQGEDLSAVLALSKLYQPPQRKRERKCRCLLCRDKQDVDESNYVNETNASMEEEDVMQSSKQSPEVDERTAQALYLYSRLYYRKGPWFRLDNLFKYYASENPSPSDDEIESDTEQDEKECSDTGLKEKRNIFFERSSLSQLNEGSDSDRQSNAKKDSVIDENKLEERMLEVARMLRDVDHLIDLGLVRSFHDEEECGKTVGAVTPEGFGILTEPERTTIVKKLGGYGKKQKKQGISAQEGKQVAANENAVWKQMCQQKSISFDPTRYGPMTKSLLPVRRHVDDLLLEKLATTIVSSSSQRDYIPSAIRKPTVAAVKARLLKLCPLGSRSLSMCLKLREAPLLTLRRCARLYICATLGPGDMRGDGTNAWTSLRDFDASSIHPDVPLPTIVRPPGSHSWHRVVHPGQHHRFGIASCAFVDAHEFVDCESECDGDSSDLADDTQTTALHVQVFSTVGAFRLWESSVELRAHVDYHLELAEMLAWRARKQRERDQGEEETMGDEPARGDSVEVGGCNQNVEASSEQSLMFEGDVPLDFLGLLTEKGRNLFIENLLLSNNGYLERQDAGRLAESIERALSSLKVCKTVSAKVDELFQNDSERLVVVFSVLISRLLAVKNEHITHEKLASKLARPWLRHLWVDGVLAYALWDCVPLLERKGFYELACSCLEIVLFGKTQKRDTDSTQAYGQNFERTALSHLLLSRRARGKAHERLVIDYKHLLDWGSQDASRNAGIDSVAACYAQTKESRKVSLPVAMSPRDVVRGVCTRLIGAVASAGSIPFSAVRSLARKVKQPLAKSLDTLSCIEAGALGIRLENGNVSSSAEDSKSEEKKGYVDWTPPTDFAVANAMAGEETDIGKRCSYVGFEDTVVDVADPSSLNVEELAMQYYATGRLPVSEPEDLQGGGWSGWHDEGGLLRALFRVICAHPILGMDSGCGKESGNALDSLERLTIHLTPYQGAPFDLHVAHSLDRPPSFDTEAEKGDESPIRSFYSRRRLQIDRFLGKLERLSGQDLCDLVYDSIVCRLDQGRTQDALLDRDLRQVRTLSMLAAGFGGQLLSAAFRCLLFDYRHYSGGLPDLLLVRALSTTESDSSNKSLIDLGEWIGEEFSAEAKTAREAAARSRLLIDKDDEYLGCSKMGDSGGQSSGRWKRGGQRRQSSRSDMAMQSDGQSKCPEKLPPRLTLRHNDKDVKVQCLFVEVKSQNDRLDGRQEDWLNILDRVGNARVCKFESEKKKSSKKAPGRSTKKVSPMTE